jgi:hypothetical protein
MEHDRLLSEVHPYVPGVVTSAELLGVNRDRHYWIRGRTENELGDGIGWGGALCSACASGHDERHNEKNDSHSVSQCSSPMYLGFDGSRPGTRIVRQQARMALGDMENDRPRLEQDEIGFLVVGICPKG